MNLRSRKKPENSEAMQAAQCYGCTIFSSADLLRMMRVEPFNCRNCFRLVSAKGE
jgi:hypothetical protein